MLEKDDKIAADISLSFSEAAQLAKPDPLYNQMPLVARLINTAYYQGIEHLKKDVDDAIAAELKDAAANGDSDEYRAGYIEALKNFRDHTFPQYAQTTMHKPEWIKTNR